MMLRAILISLALSSPAFAGALQADGTSGKLEFSGTQAGAKFTGAFGKFRVKLDFDPANPAQGSLDVTVETGSVNTQDAERDEVLRSPDFFWVEKYPEATYHAARFERDGSSWRVPGELAVRGAKKPVPVVFTLTPAAGGSAMKGSASLKRLAFGLGQGDWASTEWVGDDVEIRFDLKLTPVR
ncbi:MAG TPA: YceI family protein [Steroidobacteraceae bacterium]|jgi:polyisoprenoid-binding protein YceI|nr:YceI family protein [Steroidobacteraceae bacterium]